MNIINRSLQLRLNIGRFLNAWFRPWVLQAETDRVALNAELRQHWPDRAFTVQELIRENWEPAVTAQGGALPSTRVQSLVFIDRDEDIDWFTDIEPKPGTDKFVSAAEAVGARRCKHLPREQRFEFKRLLGLAIAEGLHDGGSESLRLTTEAATFLKERTIERSRYWTLSAAHVLLLLLSIALWVGWHWSMVYSRTVLKEGQRAVMKRIAGTACSAPQSDWKSVMEAECRLGSRERQWAKRLTARRRNMPNTQTALRLRTRH